MRSGGRSIRSIRFRRCLRSRGGRGGRGGRGSESRCLQAHQQRHRARAQVPQEIARLGLRSAAQRSLLKTCAIRVLLCYLDFASCSSCELSALRNCSSRGRLARNSAMRGCSCRSSGSIEPMSSTGTGPGGALDLAETEKRPAGSSL